jgi:hypothetical protein
MQADCLSARYFTTLELHLQGENFHHGKRMNVYSHPNPDCDLMIFKGNISCYILLLKSLLTLENTKFIAGELSLIVSLVLYLLTGHYEPR